jgi:hypothetical protein
MPKATKFVLEDLDDLQTQALASTTTLEYYLSLHRTTPASLGPHRA